MKYKPTPFEQETIIRGSAADKEWTVTTADPKIVKHLRRQGYTASEEPHLSGYVVFTVPLKKIVIRKAIIARSTPRNSLRKGFLEAIS